MNNQTFGTTIAALRKAQDAGVELYTFDCVVTPDSMALDAPVPVLL